MFRIGEKINKMNNNRVFMKEHQINNRFIDLLNKRRTIVLLILDMYENFYDIINSNCQILTISEAWYGTLNGDLYNLLIFAKVFVKTLI